MANKTGPQKDLPKDFYEDWKKTHFEGKESKGRKAEYDMVCEVRERFEQMKTARQTSCYWGTNGIIETSGSGYDWSQRWDIDDKVKLNWSLYSAFVNSQSNVKSPMSSGRINAFVNQVKKLNFAYEAFPNNDNDRNSAMIAGKILNYIWKNTDSKSEFLLAAEDAATYGSGFFRESYIKIKRKQRFAKLKDFTKEEQKIIEEGGTIYLDEEEVVVYDSPTMTYIPIRELFWDPVARTDHGVAYSARDVIWRRIIPVGVAKDLLRNMPGAKNIDKLKEGSAYITDKSMEGFFTPPQDIIGGDYVEWLEYENCVDDQYRIVVNDIPVLDSPLPLNHKEITFHKLDYKKVPGQFYGKGIPDELLMIQGAEEVLMNMATDYTYRAVKPQWIIASSVAGEINDESLSADSSVIVVDDSFGLNISDKMHQVKLDPLTFDIFRLIENYERQGTIATGIDPSQLALLTGGKTATATLQNKEQLELTISGVLDNFANGGLKSGGRQRYQNVRQHWKLPKVKKVIGDDKKETAKTQPREIRLDNIEIKLSTATKELEVIASDKDYSFFAVDDYLDPKDELNIMIRPDSIEIDSKALREQTARQNLAELSGFMVDPKNPVQMMQHPYPYINGPKWMQAHAAELRIKNDELVQPEAHEDVAIKQAEDDVTEIISGKTVPGVPGSSEAHRLFETRVLYGTQAKYQELNDKILADMERQDKEAGPQLFDIHSGQPVPRPDPVPDAQLIDELEKLSDFWMRLSKHLAEDNLPKGAGTDAALQKTPQGGGQSPMGQPMQTPGPQAPAMADMMGGAPGPQEMTPQASGAVAQAQAPMPGGVV